MTQLSTETPAALPVPEALVWYATTDGGLDPDNAAWQAFTGQAAEDYRGWGWLEALHPEDRDEVRRQWQQAASRQQVFATEYRLRRHDGVFRQVRVQAAPVPGSGPSCRWVGFVTDLTDSLEAARALKTSEERFRVLDDIGRATRRLRDADGIMAVTTEILGRHLNASRCAYADVDADSNRFTIRHDWSQPGVPSSAGVYSLDLFGPRARGDMRNGVSLVVQDVDREIGDEAGGRMFHAIGVQAIICAALVKDGRLVAMMAVHQDRPRRWSDCDLLTVEEVVDRCWAHIERTRDAAILREQDTRKDEFIATLAHELRNPLAPIKYAVMLAARSGVAPAVGRRLEVIDRQVSLMARLIDDLLDVSRINRGLIDLQRERVDLAGLVQASVEATQALIEARQHRIEVQVPAGIAIDVDPTRITQVVGNLLTNAAKYTPPGGRIAVEAIVAGGQAVLTVSDTGLGVPAADLGRLFQMFSQLPHTTSHAQGGLGLGLALVRKLVELHGGRVSASSPGLNLGSRFTVELPLADAAAAAAAAVPPVPDDGATVPEAPALPAGRDILVVEDNDDGRETLVELLESVGHRVRSAGDGPAAITLATQQPPELVLLDLGLPGMNGLQVGRWLREHYPARRMEIIALTGWGTAADMERTRQAGFDRHLTKPVEVEVLLDVVEQALEKIPR